jgi:hypothetical protein
MIQDSGFVRWNRAKRRVTPHHAKRDKPNLYQITDFESLTK